MKLCILDTETTGLDPLTCGITEIAVSLVDDTTLEVLESYTSLNDPCMPIPQAITELTGIDDAMVAGQEIDATRVHRMMTSAAMVIGHRVSFDRGFIEQHLTRPTVRYGCSKMMIDWASHGQRSTSLEDLAYRHGLLCCCPGHATTGPQEHRAAGDVELLRRLLDCRDPKRPGRRYVEELLEAAADQWKVAKAIDAPFETKDAIRDNGFRFARAGKFWWKLVRASHLSDLSAWLLVNAYLGDPALACRKRAVNVDPTLPNFEEAYGLK